MPFKNPLINSVGYEVMLDSRHRTARGNNICCWFYLLTYGTRLLLEYVLEEENAWTDTETLRFYPMDHIRTIWGKNREPNYQNDVSG